MKSELEVKSPTGPDWDLLPRLHRSGHLDELKAQIKDVGPKVKLDLDDVSLVDVEAVRFLGIYELEGVELLNCSRSFMRSPATCSAAGKMPRMLCRTV